MINIDIKDRRILYQLDLDSRQSFRSIGKKVGLSKDSVASRVQKLQQNRIIKGFYTVIDYSKLGYSSYRIYLVFQNTNPNIEKEIIKYFVDILGRDTISGIGHLDIDIVFIHIGFYKHRTAVRRVLDRIGQDIIDDHRQFVTVPVEIRQLGMIVCL